MKEMYTDSRYKNSHKKSAKIFAKAPCKALDIKPRSAQNSQLHSFTASQLHSFTASQLHSFTASQLHSFTAEGYLCPNKTITHNQIFSHKKVCSTDWNNSPKTKSYWGFQRGVPFGSAGKRGGHRGRENPERGVLSP
ncbi:hypothetical protein HMPREF9724_02480 [Treponema denticola SP37]|nr:hypothetical protein HMPREF9724_02480 [Treponema denticola SP37]